MLCPFCNYDEEIKYRLLAETDNFYLIPALGAFIEGYLMVVSKEHYDNLSFVPDKLTNELSLLEKIAKKFLEETYVESVIEYEHGGCDTNKQQSGRCINHMHLCLVSTKKKTLNKIKADLGTGKKTKNLNEIKKLSICPTSYLLYKKNEDIYYWENANILSQYMRRLLIDNDQLDKFNWRLYPCIDQINNLIKKWKRWSEKQDSETKKYVNNCGNLD